MERRKRGLNDAKKGRRNWAKERKGEEWREWERRGRG
jgi:hypothetical protein